MQEDIMRMLNKYHIGLKKVEVEGIMRFEFRNRVNGKEALYLLNERDERRVTLFMALNVIKQLSEEE